MRTAPLLPAVALALSTGCSEGGFNLFSIEDDIALGQQLRDEILLNPQDYPILDEGEHPEAYAYLYMMRDDLLATGQVDHADDFEWELYIIDDAETLNAFAAPGGYIWIYTGILKYLSEDDYFAGVLGHELAHAAERHSTEQLSKVYGLSLMIELVLGDNPGLLSEVAAGLAQLSFSRKAEAEADSRSVEYLCETSWAADGTAGFFRQLQEDGGGEIPEFLSTHPSNESRVGDITAYADSLGCDTELSDDGTEWEDFIASLP